MKLEKARIVVVLGAFASLGVLPALAAGQATPPDAGRAFLPTPVSQDRFEVSPELFEHEVRASDGVELYTKTFRPAGVLGPLPTVLIYSPYETVSDAVVVSPVLVAAANAAQPPQSVQHAEIARYFVRRGYAVTIASARGTGRSGGCLDYLGAQERDDVARVIEWLGRDAPWHNGRVGMYGLSYDGTVQLAVAGHEDTERTKYLKAIVPIEPFSSVYEGMSGDGVPINAMMPTGTLGMLLWEGPDEPRAEDRVGCHATQHTAAATPSAVTGDHDPWYAERDFRVGVSRIRAATLMAVGFLDTITLPYAPVGLFNFLPKNTPKALVLPQTDHTTPEYATTPDWRRADWRDMVTAWYDRHLKGLDSGVASWPAVQVQSASTGQWHTETSWPPLEAPTSGLALRRDMTLGAAESAGSMTYSEDSVHPAADNLHAGAGAAIWTLKLTDGPLHLTGRPRLDLWVTLDRPDAHLVANLQAFDAEGNPLLKLAADGRRSARHLEPIVDDHFVQAEGKSPPDGAFKVPIRFMPIDVVVPAGGSLRLSLAGVNPLPPLNSAPSELHSRVTVLADCPHQSVLWLQRPSAKAELLNVREPDEEGKTLTSAPQRVPAADGGSALRPPLCDG